MAWAEGPIHTETSTRGGLMGGLKRAVLAGESLFQNTYTSEGGPGKIALVPGVAGDIVAYELSGGELFLERVPTWRARRGSTATVNFRD